jgi:hypothetical protein
MKKARAASVNLFKPWFVDGDCSVNGIRVMSERVGGREVVLDALVHVAIDHVVGLKAIESLAGFPKATHVLKNRIPTGKIARPGMLGEILATEYLEQETEFTAPVRRLRYRDTREQTMRGDDVVGIHVGTSRVRVMKVEAKSLVIRRRGGC